jgi:hypothetical protein
MYKHDVNFELMLLVLVEKRGCFLVLKGLDGYNARILYVVAGTRWNFGSYSSGLTDGLSFGVCAKRIPTPAGDCPVFG